jgi:hypothetical protein
MSVHDIMTSWLQRFLEVGVFARFFSLMIRISLAEGNADDPRAVCAEARPHYHMQVWQDMGLMPVANITGSLLRRMRIVIFKRLFLLVSKIPLVARQWRHAAECAAVSHPYVRGILPSSTVRPHPDDLSLQRLYEQAVVTGFYNLQPDDDSATTTHTLDLQCLTKYPVHAGRSIYGGALQVSFARKTVVSLVTPEGRTVMPNDPEWALEAMRFRSTLFAYLTIVPHSVWCHGLLGPKMFLACWEILHPRKHPLFTLLRPYVHDLHKNCARAQLSVFGPTGVLSMVSAMTPVGVQRIISHAQHTPMFRVRLFDELVWTPQMRALMEPIWRAIRNDLVQAFLDAHQIRDDGSDSVVEEVRAFFIVHIDERFRTLSLADALAYLIFTTCVLHHLWGHLYYGSTDPTYVSAYTRTTASDKQTSSLLSSCETSDMSVVRLGVIASIQRARISIASDFACTTDDLASQRVFHAFATKMAPLLHLSHSDGYDTKLHQMASSAMF